MSPKRHTAKHLSISAEIEQLREAIDAARILAAELATDHFGSEADARSAPGAIAAVLGLVDVRAQDLGRVLRLEKDPADLAGTFNAPHTGSNEDDTALPVWSVAQRRQQAMRVLRRIDYEQRDRRRSK